MDIDDIIYSEREESINIFRKSESAIIVQKRLRRGHVLKSSCVLLAGTHSAELSRTNKVMSVNL